MTFSDGICSLRGFCTHGNALAGLLQDSRPRFNKRNEKWAIQVPTTRAMLLGTLLTGPIYAIHSVFYAAPTLCANAPSTPPSATANGAGMLSTSTAAKPITPEEQAAGDKTSQRNATRAPMHTDALGKGLDDPVTLNTMPITALAMSPTAALLRPGSALLGLQSCLNTNHGTTGPPRTCGRAASGETCSKMAARQR